MDRNKQWRAAVGGPRTIDGFDSTTTTRRHIYLDSGPRMRPQPSYRQPAPPAQPVPPPVQPEPVAVAPVAPASPPQPVPHRHVRLDMNLPGVEPAGVKHPNIRRRMGIVRRRALQVVAVALVLVLGSTSLLFMQGFFNAQKVFQGSAGHAAALQKNVNPNLLKGEGDGRINVLLLGIGGAGHDGPDLTDTMMVASIDPVNHKAVLLSIPRDTWVHVPHHGDMKINAAYAMGKYDVLRKVDSSNADSQAVQSGFAMTDQVVESVLGIDIHYNLLLNFQAFRQAVDAVGGVTVNVPTELYDPTMAWENGWNPVLAQAGIQQFDGKQALLYARSRETSSDFARGQRQRALILALKQKVAQLGTLSNPVKISGLINTLGDNVVTDLSIGDASRLYDITKQIGGNDVSSLGFTDGGNHYVTTGRVGNQSVVYPTAGMFNFSAIQTYVRKSLPDGYLMREHAAISIVAPAGDSDLASSEADDLRTYGYNIVGTTTDQGLTDTKTTLVDLSGGKKPYTKHYLEQRFGVKATSIVPPTIQKGSSDFILIVSSNETPSR